MSGLHGDDRRGDLLGADVDIFVALLDYFAMHWGFDDPGDLGGRWLDILGDRGSGFGGLLVAVRLKSEEARDGGVIMGSELVLALLKDLESLLDIVDHLLELLHIAVQDGIRLFHSFVDVFFDLRDSFVLQLSPILAVPL